MTQPTIEQRLQVLADKEEIKQLLATYAWHAARAEGEAMAALFVKESSFFSNDDAPLHGVDQVKTHFTKLTPATTIPLIHNIIIDLNGDEAFVRAKMFTPWVRTGEGTVGWYEDKVRRVNGKWLFVERKWMRHQKPAA